MTFWLPIVFTPNIWSFDHNFLPFRFLSLQWTSYPPKLAPKLKNAKKKFSEMTKKISHFGFFAKLAILSFLCLFIFKKDHVCLEIAYSSILFAFPCSWVGSSVWNFHFICALVGFIPLPNEAGHWTILGTGFLISFLGFGLDFGNACVCSWDHGLDVGNSKGLPQTSPNVFYLPKHWHQSPFLRMDNYETFDKI